MEIQQTYQNCIDGITNPSYAIAEIDRMIGGITAAFYTSKRFTIQNHLRRVSFNTQNQSKGVVKTRQHLALLAHQTAQQNGSKFPGEIHISRQASTKHHKKGIEKMLGEQKWEKKDY